MGGMWSGLQYVTGGTTVVHKDTTNNEKNDVKDQKVQKDTKDEKCEKCEKCENDKKDEKDEKECKKSEHGECGHNHTIHCSLEKRRPGLTEHNTGDIRWCDCNERNSLVKSRAIYRAQITLVGDDTRLLGNPCSRIIIPSSAPPAVAPVPSSGEKPLTYMTSDGRVCLREILMFLRPFESGRSYGFGCPETVVCSWIACERCLAHARDYRSVDLVRRSMTHFPDGWNEKHPYRPSYENICIPPIPIIL